MFISGSACNLHKTPILVVDPTTSEGINGHVGVVFHKQPELEGAIRDVIAECTASEIRSGCTLTSILEDESGVVAEYVDSRGEARHLRARFLVGADGKTGYVRKKYLEPKGVQLLRAEGTNYDETWVALNWRIRLPTPETHPDFALWSVGYTPEQVYNAFFPRDFRFLCNPARSSVCGRFGLPQDRLWRFEFVVQAGEDPDKMAGLEETRKIIHPYLVHPGSWYGVGQSSIQFPLDCIETLRSRPFHFIARSCNKWALDRVMVVGDAAHVFPPFGGQGIASGLRDAMGLAWRLSFLCRNPSADHNKLLEGWYLERKQQFDQSLAATVRNGELVTNSDPYKALARDWALWAIQLIPSWKRQLQKMSQPGIRYQHSPGLPFLPKMGGGMQLPQVYARSLTDEHAPVSFTDDLIFSRAKKGLLQLLILVESAHEADVALKDVSGVSDASEGLVLEDEATVLVHDLDARPGVTCAGKDRTLARIASADEFAADELCNGRPEPLHYNPWRIRKKLRPQARYVVVRPDRFVFAACRDKDELQEALSQLPRMLNGK